MIHFSLWTHVIRLELVQDRLQASGPAVSQSPREDQQGGTAISFLTSFVAEMLAFEPLTLHL